MTALINKHPVAVTARKGTKMNLKYEMKMEFSEFSCALLASIRKNGIKELNGTNYALTSAMRAALAEGERNGIPFSFSTKAPSCLAREWQSTCAIYGLITPNYTGGLIFRLVSQEAAADYLDHMIGEARLKLAFVGVFKAMAEVFIAAYESASRSESYVEQAADSSPEGT